MDEELKGQVTELFTSLLDTAKSEILTAVDQKNSSTAASIKRDVKAVVEPISTTLEGLKPQSDNKPNGGDKSDGGKLTLKALQQQLSQLQTELEDERTKTSKEREATFNAERSSVIDRAIAAKGLVNPGVASDTLHRRYGGKMAKEDGVWYVKDGDTVKPFDTVFGEFISTEEGEFFLPPSPTRGAGGAEPTNKTTSTTEQYSNSGAALMDAFSAF